MSLEFGATNCQEREGGSQTSRGGDTIGGRGRDAKSSQLARKIDGCCPTQVVGEAKRVNPKSEEKFECLSSWQDEWQKTSKKKWSR